MRPAPSAWRTANSFCRLAERARIKPATLAQAMSRTKPTAVMMSSSMAAIWLLSPFNASRAGTSRRVGASPWLKIGLAACSTSEWKSVFASACARSMETPVLKRASQDDPPTCRIS